MTAPWIERVWQQQYGADVARGRVPGAYVYSTFGERITSGAVSNIVIWETGMPNTLTVPDGVQLSIVSDSASDTNQISIRYINANLVELVENITMTGTTPVLTAATDIRALNSAYLRTGESAVGNITLTDDGTQYGRINPGDIQFNTSMQRVPGNKRLMIHSVYAGVTSGTSDANATIKLETTRINGDSFAEEGFLHPLLAFGLQDGSTNMNFPPIAIEPGDWVGYTAVCDKSAHFSAGIIGWLENL